MSNDASAWREIARRFVEARRAARALPGFPGTIPDDLTQAYACQDHAIGAWGDALVGWKVGRIPPAWVERLGAERLAGPVFATQVRFADEKSSTEFPVFVGGFAAVEAEYVVRVGRDAPANKVDWTVEEARDYAQAMHIGVETAGSPLATINELGPIVVVSDFGNNAGLIVGPEIVDWRARDPKSLHCETFIEGASVGRGGAGSIYGGPIGAFAFALGRAASRGMPMKAGMWVTTGAATGIHDIVAGQSSRVVFEGTGEIHCHAVAAGARA